MTASPIPTPATLVWSAIASAPITGDYYPPPEAVWDGHEMLVVITQFDPKTYCHETLLSYDPADDAWATLSRVPARKGCFEGRDRAVWTGHELLLWGISNTAYDPARGTWRHLPRPPAGAGGPSVIVWTGRQMIGWGGGCCDQELGDGAAYTPATNSWRVLPPSPLSGRHAAGVWTGSQMIIAGGEGYAKDPTDPSFDPQVVHFADAAAYDPATRHWHRLPAMPTGRGGGYYDVSYEAVWDGSEMIVVGGTRTGSSEPIARGVAFDPSSNHWRWLPPMSFPRTGFVAVWTDDQLVVWGGVGANDSIPPSGERYDPVANRWSALPKAPIRARVEAACIWTGQEVVVFGGQDARSLDHRRVSLHDGAALRPTP